MPYEGLGVRHEAVATKACVHGDIVTEDGFVGTAFKTAQVDRFTRPEDAADIPVGEEFEIQVGGVHEAPASGGLASADVGDRVYINDQTNALTLQGGAGTGTNEVQVVTISGSPTGGSITLTFRGETTAAIAYNASAATVLSRLEALDSIEAGDFAVTGSNGGPWTITAQAGGQYGGEDVPAFTHTDSLTGGTTPAAAVTNPTPGVRPGIGILPVGVITNIDTDRTPDRLRINSNAWQAFLPGS